MMPVSWKRSGWIPIYKGKRDIRSCGSCKFKLLEHSKEVVNKIFEKYLRNMIKIDKIQMGFMPGKRTIKMQFYDIL